jgi:hypothetical protein
VKRVIGVIYIYISGAKWIVLDLGGSICRVGTKNLVGVIIGLSDNP